MPMLFALILAALMSCAAPAPPPTVAWDGRIPPVVALQQPTPTPEGQGPRPRTSLPLVLALACSCNISVIALLGSIALRRRMDRISPDKE